MLKPYQNYKSSDSKFLKKIPSSWENHRFSSILGEKCIQNNSNEELLSVYLNQGVVSYKDTSQKQVHKPSEDLSKYKLVECGDVVLNNQQAWRGSVGVSTYRGIVSPAYIVLTMKIKINPTYLNYLIRDKSVVDQFVISSKGVGSIQRNLFLPYLKNIAITLPPLEEQNQIVRYLDWQTSRVDKLIEGKKKQIELFKEQKQAVINKAVTKGLDDSVPMKDSGVAWLGEIPVGWEVIRCKYLMSEINNRSETGLETHLSMSQKYGLVPDNKLDERRMLSESYVGGKLCSSGDIVLNKLKAHLGVFALANQIGVISPDYTVLRPVIEKLNPEFAVLLLKCEDLRPELRVRVRGLVEGFWRLYTDDLFSIKLAIPSVDEQKQILNYVNEYSTKVTKAIETTTKEISLLSEYKTSLISSVVTGALDVRGVEVPENY